MPLRTMQSGGPGLREASPAGTHEAVVDGVAVRADRAWCPGLQQWLQVRRVQGRLCRADQEASSRGGKVTLQRVNAGSGHYYKIDGHKVDSVTELIRGGWPPDLTRAAAVAVAEHVADHDDEVEILRDGTRLAMVETLAGEPQRKWRTKRDRGTRVHAAIARGDRHVWPDDLDPPRRHPPGDGGDARRRTTTQVAHQTGPRYPCPRGHRPRRPARLAGRSRSSATAPAWRWWRRSPANHNASGAPNGTAVPVSTRPSPAATGTSGRRIWPGSSVPTVPTGRSGGPVHCSGRPRSVPARSGTAAPWTTCRSSPAWGCRSSTTRPVTRTTGRGRTWRCSWPRTGTRSGSWVRAGMCSIWGRSVSGVVWWCICGRTAMTCTGSSAARWCTGIS